MMWVDGSMSEVVRSVLEPITVELGGPWSRPQSRPVGARVTTAAEGGSGISFRLGSTNISLPPVNVKECTMFLGPGEVA